VLSAYLTFAAFSKRCKSTNLLLFELISYSIE
jgi:hypothetical protein